VSRGLVKIGLMAVGWGEEMTARGLAITAESHPIDLFSTFLSLPRKD